VVQDTRHREAVEGACGEVAQRGGLALDQVAGHRAVADLHERDRLAARRQDVQDRLAVGAFGAEPDADHDPLSQQLPEAVLDRLAHTGDEQPVAQHPVGQPGAYRRRGQHSCGPLPYAQVMAVAAQRGRGGGRHPGGQQQPGVFGVGQEHELAHGSRVASGTDLGIGPEPGDRVRPGRRSLSVRMGAHVSASRRARHISATAIMTVYRGTSTRS
jgi:hypothetical protein